MRCFPFLFLLWLLCFPVNAQEYSSVTASGPVRLGVPVGGARYLALLAENSPICSILDIEQESIVQQIPMKNPQHTLVAGSREFLFFIDAKTKLVERWLVAKWKREEVQSPGVDLPILGAACGPFADGPLLLYMDGQTEMKVVFLDIERLLPIDIATLKVSGTTNILQRSDLEGGFTSVGVSGDGLTFSFAPMGSSLSLLNGGLEWISSKERFLAKRSYPDFSGRFVYVGPTRYEKWSTYGYPLKRSAEIVRQRWSPSALFPSVDNDWYASLSDQQLEIIAPEGHAPAFKLPIGDLQATRAPPDRIPKLFFYGAKKKIIQPTIKSEVRIWNFDYEKELDKVGNEYLSFTSTPNVTAYAGEKYESKLQLVSSRQPCQLQLLSGPSGMILDGQQLTWNVNAESVPATNLVQVMATNPFGMSSIHSFNVRVKKRESKADFGRGTREPKKTNEISCSGPALKIPEVGYDLQFPAAVTAGAVAGGGRYYCAYLQALSQLMIIDLALRRPVRLIELDTSGPVCLAGTQDSVFVLSIESQSLTRYTIQDGANAGVRQLPQFPKTNTIRAGSYGSGPLYACSDNVRLFDAKDMSSIHGIGAIPGNRISAVTSDGRGFLLNRSSNTNGFGVYDSDYLRQPQAFVGDVDSVNFNGSLVFTKGGTYSRKGRVISISPTRERTLAIVSALHGNLFCAVSQSNQSNQSNEGDSIFVSTPNSPRFIESYTDLPTMLESSLKPRNDEPLDLSNRIMLIPEHRCLAILPPGEDRLHFRPFDWQEKLEKGVANFLFVDSLPPAFAVAGKRLDYQVEVIASKMPVSISIADAPVGAKMEGDRFVWDVPNRSSESEFRVQVKIVDATGQTIEHEFCPQFVEPMALDNRPPPQQQPNPSVRKPIEMRKWKDKSGKKTVEAKFIKRLPDSDKIELELKDGSRKTISLMNLSSADQAYVSQISEGQ